MVDAPNLRPEVSASPEPQRPAARSILGTVIAGVAIALVAGSFGYLLKQPAPDVNLPLAPETPSIMPETLDPAPSEEEAEIVGGAQGLKIVWAPRADMDTGLNFFPQKSYDGSVDLPVTYTRVGSVRGGEYEGYSLYLVEVPCEGPCFRNPVYRMLWQPPSYVGGSEKIVLLQRYSAQDAYQSPAGLTVLTEARIPELEFPATIRTPEGATLSLNTRDDRAFLPQGKKFAFRDARVGDVFGDDLALAREYGTPQNGFYAVAPDGTAAIYEVAVPFIGEEQGSVPAITWTEGGARNTFDYQYTDVGGCGSFNLASVILPSQIERERDLLPIGKAANGDTIYGFRDAKHPVVAAMYEGYLTGRDPSAAESYETFVASKPLFIWIDPLGRFIKFQRSSYLPAVECGKPVIYLYPERATDVSVKVDLKGGLSKSEPSYDGGWNVTAQPDGRLTDLRDGSEWPYLFWEGRGGLYETPKKGWVVKREEVPVFLRSTLAAYGLNEREIADFTEFWLPRMTSKPWYFVTFLGTKAMDQLAPLEIVPKPKTVFRILMDYAPLDEPVAVEPLATPRKFARDGFTVVEWGGVLGRE